MNKLEQESYVLHISILIVWITYYCAYKTND